MQSEYCFIRDEKVVTVLVCGSDFAKAYASTNGFSYVERPRYAGIGHIYRNGRFYAKVRIKNENGEAIETEKELG